MPFRPLQQTAKISHFLRLNNLTKYMKGVNFSWENELSFSSKSFLVFTAIYFPMMTAFPFTIDSEYAAFASGRLDWVAQGRWANYLVEKYLFRPVVPFFTIAFFGVCISLSYTLFLRACRLPYDYKFLLAFAVFAGFPIWSTILEFPANTPSVGLGLLACTIAAFDCKARSNIYLLLSRVALVTFSIGAYQSFIFVYASLSLLVLTLNYTNFKESLYSTILIALVSILSVAAHHIIQEIFLEQLNVSLGYIGKFFDPSHFISDPWAVTVQTVNFMLQIYKGKASFYGASLWAAPVIIVIALVVAAQRSWVALVLLVAALLAPVPLVAVAGGWLPVRTLIAAPLALGGCAMIILSSRNQLLLLAGWVLCAILAIQSAAAISQYQAQRTLISIYDQNTAAEIYTRIGEVAEPNLPVVVDFYGGLNPPQTYPIIPSSTAYGSFFSWNGGNPWRILSFMRLIGYPDLHLADLPTRESMKIHAESMPVWPAAGSVRRIGEVVLIKLGETPGVYSP